MIKAAPSMPGSMALRATYTETTPIRRRAEQPMETSDSKAPAVEADLADFIAVRDAIETLPETQQDLVILHDLEQFTLKETASLLAIPFDTAKDRLRRARSSLREHLHSDITQAVTGERRTTSRLAKAAAPAVLAGVLSSMPSSAVAGNAAATGVSKLIVVGALAMGVAIGAAAHHWASSPSPSASGDSAPAQLAQASLPATQPGISEERVMVEPDGDVRGVEDAGLLKAKNKSAPKAVEPAVKVSPEGRLVERGRVFLRRGRSEQAIRTLMAHERRFPSGQLAEERDVLLIEAYLAAGNLRLASMRLDHYRISHPTGFHRQRADAAGQELKRRK